MPLELSGKEVWTWSSEYERLTPNERRIGSLQNEIPYGGNVYVNPVGVQDKEC